MSGGSEIPPFLKRRVGEQFVKLLITIFDRNFSKSTSKQHSGCVAVQLYSKPFWERNKIQFRSVACNTWKSTR